MKLLRNKLNFVSENEIFILIYEFIVLKQIFLHIIIISLSFFSLLKIFVKIELLL